MRYLLIPTDDSTDRIPIEIPDNIIVNNTPPKIRQTKRGSDKKQKVVSLPKLKNKSPKKTKTKLKKKVQRSRPYGEIHNRNI